MSEQDLLWADSVARDVARIIDPTAKTFPKATETIAVEAHSEDSEAAEHDDEDEDEDEAKANGGQNQQQQPQNPPNQPNQPNIFSYFGQQTANLTDEINAMLQNQQHHPTADANMLIRRMTFAPDFMPNVPDPAKKTLHPCARLRAHLLSVL